jgi:hypothetical protein
MLKKRIFYHKFVLFLRNKKRREIRRWKRHAISYISVTKSLNEKGAQEKTPRIFKGPKLLFKSKLTFETILIFINTVKKQVNIIKFQWTFCFFSLIFFNSLKVKKKLSWATFPKERLDWQRSHCPMYSQSAAAKTTKFRPKNCDSHPPLKDTTTPKLETFKITDCFSFN